MQQLNFLIEQIKKHANIGYHWLVKWILYAMQFDFFVARQKGSS